MINSSISVSFETKQALTVLQKKFEFKTYDSCINSIAAFMLKNEVNPKDDFIGDFKLELIRLEKRLIDSLEISHKKLSKDNASLRSWVGGITNEHLVPLSQKLSVLDKLNILEINEKLSNNLQNSKIENPLNDKLPTQKVEQETEDNNTEELDHLNRKYKELFSKYDDQKQILFKIINSAKIEQGGMISKDKIIVNLPLEEWEIIRTSI